MLYNNIMRQSWLFNGNNATKLTFFMCRKKFLLHTKNFTGVGNSYTGETKMTRRRPLNLIIAWRVRFYFFLRRGSGHNILRINERSLPQWMMLHFLFSIGWRSAGDTASPVVNAFWIAARSDAVCHQLERSRSSAISISSRRVKLPGSMPRIPAHCQIRCHPRVFRFSFPFSSWQTQIKR